jgi:transcriptional regulator with XRE-family HTH domain
MNDFYALSNAELVKMLGKRFKTYRIKCRMTQSEMADQTGVSVPTIRSFENGRSANVSLQVVLALLRGVGQLEQIECLLPEITDNPKDVFLGKQQPKRVRHGK